MEEEAEGSQPKVSVEIKLNHKEEKNTLEDAGLSHENILEDKIIKESISGEPDFRNFADEERKKGGKI